LLLHGDESLEFVEQLAERFKIIKVFGIDQEFDFTRTKAYEPYVEYFLFDTKTPLYGGSGLKFNWQKLEEYRGMPGFILSGGITADDAMDLLDLEHEKFAGVDINSGFEIKPGVKNIELIEKLLKKVKHEEPR
jgi:phosphoribosylanthranilate isomerase